jgi:hypothetical protein
MMWFLSHVGKVPTPNVCLDIWDQEESYKLHILLARRLKITFSPSLKLTISFLASSYYYYYLL